MPDKKLFEAVRQQFIEFLTQKKLRLTPQRTLILEAFLKAKTHVTAEELYAQVRKKDASVGQATVYRTLKLLSESGIAREVNFGDGWCRYEQKCGQEHHDHLICDRCGKNIEFVDEKIEKLQTLLAESFGFELTGHSMYLYGICPDCRKGSE